MRVVVKNVDGEIELFVRYWTITDEHRSVTQQNGTVVVVAASCAIFALVGFALNLAGLPWLMRWAPLWAVAAVLLFAFHLYSRRRYLLVGLTDGRSIFFLADRPSRERLLAFLHAMTEARETYRLGLDEPPEWDDDPDTTSEIS